MVVSLVHLMVYVSGVVGYTITGDWVFLFAAAIGAGGFIWETVVK